MLQSAITFVRSLAASKYTYKVDFSTVPRVSKPAYLAMLVVFAIVRFFVAGA